MDTTTKRAELEALVKQAREQVAAWNEKLIGATYQLALLNELAPPEEPPRAE